jgi:hypothetical protein
MDCAITDSRQTILRFLFIILFLWCSTGIKPVDLFAQAGVVEADKETSSDGWSSEKTARLLEHVSVMEKDARKAEIPSFADGRVQK